MRMRLPVLILVGVLGLSVLFSFSGPRHFGDIILRSPIVLLQRIAARVAGMFARDATGTPAPVESTVASSGEPAMVPQPHVVKDGDVTNLPRRTGASQYLPGRPQQGEAAARSISSPERLRPDNPGGAPRGSQSVIAARPASGFELARDNVAGNPPILTGVEPPAAAQPPVSVQPPTDLQPPSGIVPAGVVPLLDSLMPPGGVFPQGLLPTGVLPAGTLISPGGLALLPGGGQLQLPGVQVPGVIQPGQAQVGPVQVGPAQSGPGQAGPVQVGPIQIGPIQITPP